MVRLMILLGLAMGLSLSHQALAQGEVGDRQLGTRLRYPAAAFVSDGGRVIDITRPPYNAKGDGISDDTKAFVAAYDDLMNGIEKAALDDSMGPRLKSAYFQKSFSPILYIPDGTYLVSNTIIYSGRPRLTQNRTNELLLRVRFIGESRERTIIKLKDGSPGFGKGARKPVLSYGKHRLNNSAALNACRNLTIDTGRQNPGAVGLLFSGANSNGIRNLKIRSGDGAGHAGLWFDVGATQGYYRDITVEGFDYGILMRPFHATQLVFEHVTLRGQNRAGMRTENSSFSIRKLYSQNRVPSIELGREGALAVVLDSLLVGGSPETGGIEVGPGHLFARDVRMTGYKGVVSRSGKVQPQTWVTEFATGPKQGASLRLPVRESPIPPSFGPDLWANVDDFGAVGDGKTDDSEAVQAALNSGKSVIFFPKMQYRTDTPLRIPTTVRRVNFLFGTMNGATFRIQGSSHDSVVFEDGFDLRVVDQGRRPVVLNDLMLIRYNLRGVGGGGLFVNSCAGFSYNKKGEGEQKVWFRQVNRETRQQGVNWTCRGSDWWVLGFKCEGGSICFNVTGGGRLEVLGGLVNQTRYKGRYVTAFRSHDSDISLVAHTNVATKGAQNYRSLITDIQGAKRNLYGFGHFAHRGRDTANSVINLFSSRRNSLP